MEWIVDYIAPITLGICLCVGYIIKAVFKSAALNQFIPLIVAVLGVGISIWCNHAVTPEVVLTGLASGLASTGMHELFKNFIELKDKDGLD